MRKLMYLIVAVVGVGLAISGINALAQEHPGSAAKETPKAGAEKVALTQSVFVCPDCHTMALKAGKCVKCGKEMTEMHLLGTKEGNALICKCEKACKCDITGVKDDKCACGKEVTKVSAKGMYVCPDGCPEMTEKAGKCVGCSKELKKVE